MRWWCVEGANDTTKATQIEMSSSCCSHYCKYTGSMCLVLQVNEMWNADVEENFANLTGVVINENSGLIPLFLAADAHHSLILELQPSPAELKKNIHFTVSQ